MIFPAATGCVGAKHRPAADSADRGTVDPRTRSSIALFVIDVCPACENSIRQISEASPFHGFSFYLATFALPDSSALVMRDTTCAAACSGMQTGPGQDLFLGGEKLSAIRNWTLDVLAVRTRMPRD